MTIPFSAVGLLTVTTAFVVNFFLVGLARAAKQANISHARTLPWSVATGVLIWLAVTAILAQNGVLSVWTDRPPRWQLLPPIALVTLAFLSLTRSFGRLLQATARWQPVALQLFRIGVELAFWRLHVEGVAPVQVTFEGRNFDVLVGLTAPIVALGIAQGWIGPRMTIGWNVFGLVMLFNAIVTVFTSAPGPLHLNWPGEPFTAIAAWPVVWIPALLAPVAIFLHTVSIRQSLSALSLNSPIDEGVRHDEYKERGTSPQADAIRPGHA